jgi:hypothetical protein
VREVETSEQCRWAECGNDNRWQTSFSLIVVKAGSGGVQPLASLRRMGPAGGRRRKWKKKKRGRRRRDAKEEENRRRGGGAIGAALKFELKGERK